ncbi:MAG: CAP domain-containing protein [Akkermansiaceae bacterium]|jgi:uncharacterized protein YkwD|nr:CAP domain-containing protein [Akkermansiaceae bacterium]
MKSRLAIGLISLLGMLPGLASHTSDELLASFQSKIDAGEEIDEILDSLESLESADLKDLLASLNKAWPQVLRAYGSAFEKAAAKPADPAAFRETLKSRRQAFMKVYAMAEGPMKPELAKTSMPAIEELAKLLSPTAETLVESDPSLAKMRRTAQALASFRDAALEAAISTTPVDSLSTLEATEQEAILKSSPLPRDGLRILADNRKIAEKNEVPADEARGIEECNLWRLYVGLNALVLDPKLCDAARDHSKDMATLGFFAHESPVEGKKTPWDRAKNFDTTASGENIYAGSADPGSANRGWFFSPGHHKNMFSPGQRRIGLGRHNGHWTQLFGN